MVIRGCLHRSAVRGQETAARFHQSHGYFSQLCLHPDRVKITFPEPHSLMSCTRPGEMQMCFLLFINYDQSNLKREELRTSAQLMDLLISFLYI